ncbi:MAG TPA: hypothetical protein VD862_04680 [Candidatus Paceibacterota bacterium]|nr:hypothetical protein [Candidatus Paceibacterota bacterium]
MSEQTTSGTDGKPGSLFTQVVIVRILCVLLCAVGLISDSAFLVAFGLPSGPLALVIAVMAKRANRPDAGLLGYAVITGTGVSLVAALTLARMTGAF